MVYSLTGKVTSECGAKACLDHWGRIQIETDEQAERVRECWGAGLDLWSGVQALTPAWWLLCPPLHLLGQPPTRPQPL